MNLFKTAKSEPQDAETSVLLEQKDAQITALTEQVATLQAFYDRQIKLNDLVTKSAELGFTGNVASILDSAEGNLATALGNMISAFRVEVGARTEVFTETAAEEDAGDTVPTEIDEAKPTSQSAAVAIVKSTYSLSGKLAVAKARELFPTVMGGQNG
jgi:hypothetical protein